MLVPSLLELCVQQIANNEGQLKSLHLVPEDLKYFIKKASIFKHWKWFIKPLDIQSNEKENSEKKNTIDLATDVSGGSEYHCFEIMTNVFEFVREKGRISGMQVEYSVPTTQRYISLYYKIPIYERIDCCIFGDVVRIAGIQLPSLNSQTIKIEVSSLEEINKKVSLKWSDETYKKTRDFVIYYVNQFAIDNLSRPYLNTCTITDNRLYLAQNSQTDEAAMKSLFGQYEGPLRPLL